MIRYEFTKRADRELQRFPLEIQRRIIIKIKFYCTAPEPLHFAKKIESEEKFMYRFRIGTYRVIFEWNNDMITVVKVAHRREAYKA
ncbi:type II toxin-antitoxin system RelE/ParE family toxin [Candidatus Roizmanbacteria bacterium]|nr:type II toxin-antitoxin system RelE/ParE family toxin [Candidatus Roizmanbacteria bacterium]